MCFRNKIELKFNFIFIFRVYTSHCLLKQINKITINISITLSTYWISFFTFFVTVYSSIAISVKYTCHAALENKKSI